jgi:RND family efflux transporter MFP subunit
MDSSRTTAAVVKAVMLLIILAALYFLWTERTPQLKPGEQEEAAIGPTDVAVDVGTIRRVTMRGYVTAFGAVQPSPASANQPAANANITVPSPALVDQVSCYEGQRVDQGQVLFTLDSRAADANIQLRREALTNFQANYDRLLEASKTSTIPAWHLSQAQQQRDSAQSDLDAALTQKKLLTFTSPISGTVVNVRVSAGAVADPAVAAVEVVDLDRLIVEVAVPGSELSAVKPGQSASLTFAANAATQPSAIVSSVVRVDPILDSRTNLGAVDISVPAQSGLWPGEWAQAEIVCQEHPDCLAVPAQSIVRDSMDRPFIGVVSDDGHRAVLEPVETGLRDGDLVEVRSPDLREGQTVVTAGSAGLLVRTDIRILKGP